MLLDSNIIIYASQQQYDQIRQFISENDVTVSAVSYVEVLGYHQLTNESRLYFAEFFQLVQVLPINQRILEQAVNLRQVKRMTLGDAIVAATTLVHGRILVTRNTEDFEWIPEIQLLNPFSPNST